MIKKILLIVFLFPTMVNAHENDYFKIDMKDTFNEVIIEDNNYTWTSKNDTNLPQITITIQKNDSITKQDVSKYSEENLLTYKKNIEKKFKESLKEYDLTVKISDITKDKLNNYEALYYTTFWPTKESFKYDMYQKTYLITTDKYITTINIIDSTEKTSNEIKDILKSIKINDNNIKKESFFEKQTNQIIIVGLVAGLLGFIISVITRRKRK